MATTPPIVPDVPLTQAPPNRLTDTPEEFYNKADAWNDGLAYSWQPAINQTTLKMNELSGWMGVTSIEMVANRNASETAANEANVSKIDSQNARDEAVAAAAEIKGYVIPTDPNLTYNKEIVDAKISMSETLYITGA